MIRAFVFPGQGSQKKGMGENLFDSFPEITNKADRILGYSIKDLCLEDPQNLLNLTQYTQPALYVVNALMYFKKQEGSSENPVYLAGHSLGEYSALFAAQAFDFETGLRLVQKRGEIMSRAKGGGMAAIIGLDGERIREVLQENEFQGIDIANYNSPFQTVISGPSKDIEKAKGIFEEAEAKLYIPLKVSGAFHSRYMETARGEFEAFLENFKFRDLTIPVISNVKARAYTKERIKQLLADQINHSVKWTESIRYLMGKGVEEFEEVGPGRVLTGLIQKIRKEAEPLVIPENMDTLAPKGAVEQRGIKVTGPGEDNDAELKITVSSLGSREFFNIKYAYIAGSMYKGISSKEMVVRMGKAGLMGFLGTGGLAINQIEDSIQYIKRELPNGNAYGVNLLNNLESPESEARTVDLFLKDGVHNVEASAYMQMTPSLVLFRLK
ncbi:MAG: ACP S-malonyltransferase, partial [bacterium]